jgi:hypothetical protein
MEAKNTARALVLILVLASAVSLASRPQAGSNTAAAAPSEKEKPPIVRTDLLFLDAKEPAPPLRDIFRPKAARTPVPRPTARPASAKKPAAPPPEAAAGFALDLTYIGSVGVSGRTMALVLRGGQTVSVAEGDEILPGYRVVRITPEEIVVEGPNSERKTFTR